MFNLNETKTKFFEMPEVIEFLSDRYKPRNHFSA